MRVPPRWNGDTLGRGGFIMSSVEKFVVVDAPISAVYDQWTQFEEFPRFMEGVQEVRQLDDRHLHWRAEIGGHTVEWDAAIIEQLLERHVAWRSISGAKNAGTVSFEPVDAGRTRVTLRMSYEPRGAAETVADWAGVFAARVEGDLRRFKEFMESRATATGGWHGEIQADEVVPVKK
jgi:uncharacterized membrane protein